MKYIFSLLMLISINVYSQCENDSIAPTFTMPDLILEYSNWDQVPSYNYVTDLVYETLEDNCMNTSTPPCYCGPTLISSILDSNDYFVTYKYQAYDLNANYSPLETITFFVDPCLEDTIPPYFITYPIPFEETYDCTIPIFENLEAVDAEGGEVTIGITIQPIACGCPIGASYIIYYTATDLCGNSSQVSSTVVVRDYTPPVIVSEALDFILECDSASYNSWWEQFIYINTGGNGGESGYQAQDACSLVEYTYNELDSVEYCEGNMSKIVEFIATDECGNYVTDTAYFTIQLPNIIEEIDYKQGLNVYPNPNNGTFIVESDTPFEIYNALGEIVIDNFSSGVYFVINKDEIKRFVIY